MSEAGPCDAEDQALMWRLAAAWVRARPAGGSGSRLLDSVLVTFQPITEGAMLQEAAKASLPLDSGPTFGWLIGKALPKSSPAMIPVVTIQLDGTSELASRCCIRVGLFSEREDGTIEVHGWRFELGENQDDALHPYQHAQAIVGWNISGTCLLHPPGRCADDCEGLDPSGTPAVDAERVTARSRINQSHPAFPFPTKSMTGLMASTLATLYGAGEVRDMIDNDSRLSRASGAGEDLRRLFG